MFRHDPAHTGTTNSTAPKDSPTTLWSLESKGYASISPAIANGIVYASTRDLYAYNASTGEALWSVPKGGQSSPVVANGIVYTGAYDGTAYNASTGTVIWSVGNQASYKETITVCDGYFYSNNEQGYVQARNATTGVTVWTSISANYAFYPACSAGYLYCIGFDGSAILSALDAYDGSLIWQTMVSHSELSSSPAVLFDHVYVGCYDGNVYCLDAYTGEKAWNYTTGGWVRSCPAVAYGYIYVGSLDRKVYALNASTGELFWSFTTDASSNSYGVNSSPTVADGVLYIGADDGNLYALDAHTGAKLWSINVQSELDEEGAIQSFFSTPAIAYGNIYIISKDHFITAISENNQPNNWQIILLIVIVIILILISLIIIRHLVKK